MPTLVLKLGERELSRLSVARTRVIIGRDEGCDLRIENPAVSRHHARVDYGGGVFRISDISSGNGFLINGQVVSEAQLYNGTEIQIGKFLVRFLEAGGVPPEELEPVTAPLLDPEPFDVLDTTLLDPRELTKMRDGAEQRDRERHRTQTAARIRLARRARLIRRVMTAAVVGLLVLGAVMAYLVNR